MVNPVMSPIELLDMLQRMKVKEVQPYYEGMLALVPERDKVALITFLDLLHDEGLIFLYQDRVGDMQYQYLIKKTEFLPINLFRPIALDFVGKTEFPAWFLRTKTNLLRTAMMQLEN